MADSQENPEDAAPDTQPSDAESLLRERDDYLARWQRATADYQNLKRRSASDVENAVRHSLEGLLASMLLAVDHLELALSSKQDSDDARALAEGVGLTRDQIIGALRQEGVEQISEGGEFDPNLHEAVSTLESSDMEPGQVVDTLRRGYTWRGQVLRAAHVRVSRAPQEAGETG